jgi:hypothetical protein
VTLRLPFAAWDVLLGKFMDSASEVMRDLRGKKMRTSYLLYCVWADRVACAALLVMVCGALVPVFAADVPEWLDEFEDICSQVEVVDSLSREEIQSLVDRCDKLMPVIESSDDRKKKVYLFRLKRARDMFEATLQIGE